VVRPGDAVVGDQDGVVVVPAAAAENVIKIAKEREVIEEVIKEELIANPGSPGTSSLVLHPCSRVFTSNLVCMYVCVCVCVCVCVRAHAGVRRSTGFE
jgi:hypothetical protein